MPRKRSRVRPVPRAAMRPVNRQEASGVPLWFVGLLIFAGVLLAFALLFALFRVIDAVVFTVFDRLSSVSAALGVAFAVLLCLLVILLIANGGALYWKNRLGVVAYWLPRLRRQALAVPSPNAPVLRIPGVVPGTIGVVLVVGTLVLTGGSVAANALSVPMYESAPVASMPTPAPTATRLPTATPTVAPTATAIPPTATTAPPTACTTLNCNPWGYSFSGSALIYDPPGEFCSYFACINNFWNGNGYVVECADERYSKSGGIQGACSQHGGVWRKLYAP
jgi:hypothetical protein